MQGFKVPHFQVVLGGQWEENAGAYGLPVVAIPSKRIPDALTLLTDFYLREREKNEAFPKFVGRIGKAKLKQLLDPLTQSLVCLITSRQNGTADQYLIPGPQPLYYCVRQRGCDFYFFTHFCIV